jgi:carbonic anhydrase
MSVIEQLVAANAAYARDFDLGGLSSPPSRRVAIVTCMDARLDPARFLGLAEGDAHVIRNAGGCAREALRSLAVSQHLLGTNEIAVIRHTDCGMGKYSDSEIAAKVEDSSGGDASGIEFRAFADLDQAVAADLQYLRSSDLIAGATVIRGFVYDVKSGRLEEIL